MTEHVSLLVFSDLDGTLLDHESYQWKAATEALRALRDIGAGLVLASSKTAPEISQLRAQIGFEDWPAIVENGAGVLPAHTQSVSDLDRYADLRAQIDRVPGPLREKFRGFGDMGVDALVSHTGLPESQAKLAKTRAFSEPGLWSGTQDELESFLAVLSEAGIIGQRGGRFVTLSFGGNKADRVTELTKMYSPRYTVALGDAPNDIKMLESTDFGVVVANPHSRPLPRLNGAEKDRIIRTKAAGPQGWNEAVLALISQLSLKRT